MPGRMGLDRAGVGVEQQRRRARLLDPVPRRAAVERSVVAAEPDLLTVDHHPAADQTRRLGDLSAATAGDQHHLYSGAVAGLEPAPAEQCERAILVVKQRGAAPEERAVEVRVDAAQRHQAAASWAYGGRWTIVSCGPPSRRRPSRRSRSRITDSTWSAIGRSACSGWWWLRRSPRSDWTIAPAPTASCTSSSIAVSTA